VEVTGQGVIDLTVWRQQNSCTVHLVNLTNPMMMKGPLREFIPLGEQRVRVRLPDNAAPKSVRLLAAQGTVPIKRDGEYLEVTIPSIVDHEIVAIDL